MPDVICMLNPITRKRVKTTIPAGRSLHESMKLPDDIHIEYNGYPYHGETLKEDDRIVLIVAPKGGDTGKGAARTGLILAATVAASAAFPGSGLGMIALRAGIATAAVIGANSLIPPKL